MKDWLGAMVVAGRVLLGAFYLLSGLNWYFGFMPLPSIDMPPDASIKHAVVAEMIRTGWMFQFAKTAEIAAGIALLANRLVPLALALTVPLAFITFMLDALILDDLQGWFTGSVSGVALWDAVYDMIIGGLCVLLLHVWLMLCYWKHYRLLFSWRGALAGSDEMPAAPAQPLGRNWLKALAAVGWLALALQAWNFYLFLGLIGR